MRQEKDCDHFGARHQPLHTRIPGAGAPDQCAATQWEDGAGLNLFKATPAGAGGIKDHTIVQPPEVTKQKSDLLICGLWQQGTDSVHNMQVVKTDALAHRTKDPERCLHEAERGGKRMYLEA